MQVVIIVEGTGGLELLLPVILAIVLSNWVAHHIHTEGAYESDLERIGKIFASLSSRKYFVYSLRLPTCLDT